MSDDYRDLFTDGINHPHQGPPDERSLLGYLCGGLNASSEDGLTPAECAAWSREIDKFIERTRTKEHLLSQHSEVKP